MYPICPEHECAHFRSVLTIFHIFGPTCTIFSPPCTPDEWTNGPYMVCFLCMLVATTHMPRGPTNAPIHRELAQSECGHFCHLGACGLNSGHHHALAHGDLSEPSTCGPTLDSHWVPQRMLSPVSKPPWRNTLGDTFIFGSFLGIPNHPFWDPNFSHPCGLLAAPYL